MVRAELARRYGDEVEVLYHNAESESIRSERAELIDDFEKRALLYPVTVVDGVAVYDGAVSYPAIMRAVENRLSQREHAAEA